MEKLQPWLDPRNLLLFICYIFVIVLQLPVRAYYWAFSRKNKRETLLCIESGAKGWELIEYKELLSSAQEFLGESKVQKISFDVHGNYVPHVLKTIRKFRPTHYLLDSRTGSQRTVTAICQSVLISMILNIFDVSPICTLTDAPVRRWRYQTAILTASRGTVLCLMLPKDLVGFFPHSRIYGPMLMPFSKKTLGQLVSMRKSLPIEKSGITFIGSLYEPRTSIINAVRLGLNETGITFNVRGRQLGSNKFSDEEYWKSLAEAGFVFTTANQVISSETDPIITPHLIYRYLEAIAAGSVLVAQSVPGISRYFTPGVHFVEYSSPEEAVSQIKSLSENLQLQENIRTLGTRRAEALIETNSFWSIADVVLGKHSLLN